jgi:hypothetical protein
MKKMNLMASVIAAVLTTAGLTTSASAHTCSEGYTWYGENFFSCGRADKTTKKCLLTLPKGSTIDIKNFRTIDTSAPVQEFEQFKLVVLDDNKLIDETPYSKDIDNAPDASHREARDMGTLQAGDNSKLWVVHRADKDFGDNITDSWNSVYMDAFCYKITKPAEPTEPELLINQTPTTTECPNGGVKITVGHDDNGNGTLDAVEVESTSVVCNGKDGKDGRVSLINVTEVNTSATCPNGGLMIASGIDCNRNGTLDSYEETSFNVVCNGTNGTNGTDGQDGTDGLTPLFDTTPIPPSSSCPNGGTQISIGYDVNENGVLDNSEITKTFTICNPAPGQDGVDGVDGQNAKPFITTSEVIAPSSDCPNGGVRVSGGLDTNNNGVLDTDEVTTTYDICNGTNGTNGQDVADGTDGVNGLNALINTTEADASVCPNGGTTFLTGSDTNVNDILDDVEVTGTATICNPIPARDGVDGVDGHSVLVSTFELTASDYCPADGILITTGTDLNDDGMLDYDEVTSTDTICNGVDGFTTLTTTTEATAEECIAGGVVIRTGLDTNRNFILDESEITSSTVVCNGKDGRDGVNGQDGNTTASCDTCGVAKDSGGINPFWFLFGFIALLLVVGIEEDKRV